jgi:hypothetical protein
MHSNNPPSQWYLNLRRRISWKILLIVIIVLTTFPLSGDRDYGEVDELESLPTDHQFKQATLELLYNLQRNLVINQELEETDRELIMR